MHMARLGGHRSEKRINPADVDSYIQSPRNSIKAEAKLRAESIPNGEGQVQTERQRSWG